MRFRLLTPPATEPVAIADLMAFARVDADPGDGVLQRLLTAARQRVERDTGVALIWQTWVASLDRWPTTPAPDFPRRRPSHRRPGVFGMGWGARLFDRPAFGIERHRDRAAAVSSPSCRSRCATSRRRFRASTRRPSMSRSATTRDASSASPAPYGPSWWPEWDDAIEITVVLGFGAAASSVPSDLQTAILMLAAHWARSAPNPSSTARASTLPEHVRSILSSWQGRAAAMIVQPGRMRERVVLQQAAVSVDAAGDPAYAWSDIATVWARVEPSGGGVEVSADRRSATEAYEVTIRWRMGVSARQRLVWRSRYLQIERVQNSDERPRARLTLECRDVGPTP